MEPRAKIFDAPIPGQSLTAEPGSSPVEQPPQYADVEQALEFLWDKLNDKRQVTRLVLMLKKGVSVEYIARTIMFDGFTRGKWTPDGALLMLRIVMAMIIAIAVNAGVPSPTIMNKDIEQAKFLDQFLEGEDSEVMTSVEDSNEGVAEVPQLPEFKGILGSIE